MSSHGFYDLAVSAVDKLTGNEALEAQGLLFLFELYRQRGQAENAEKMLTKLDKILAPGAAERVDLADAYERIKQPKKALAIWEGLNQNAELGQDNKMRIAWLHSSLNQKEEALGIWRSLWDSVKSESRRRFIEDRMIMIAVEIGRIGDLVIELEEKIVDGKATRKDTGLLTRLYTKAGDIVSATEIIEEGVKLQGKGAHSVESYQEQAKIFLSLNDYNNYIRLTRHLLKMDPENKVDYLRNLIMVQIQQDITRIGKDRTDDMNRMLAELRELDNEAVGGEFEAGVYILAGFKEEAIEAYRLAMARFPERSDNYLLLGDLLKTSGKKDKAITMFQYLAEKAEDDALFMVALDGITNMSPEDSTIVRWAQRVALER
jgi:tetratricopeptide (TPR) repeat protein